MASLEREDEESDVLTYILGIFFLIAVTIPIIIFSKNDINTLSTFGLPAEDSFYVKIFNQFIEDNKEFNKTSVIDNNDNTTTLDYNISFDPMLYQPLNLNIIIENHNISIIRKNKTYNFIKRYNDNNNENDESNTNEINYNQDTELYKGEEDDDDEEEDDDEDGWFDEEEEEFDNKMFFNSFIKTTAKNILITTIISYAYLILIRFIPFIVTIISLGVSVYFVGAFIYKVLPDLLKYITTNTDLLLWPILIYCIIAIICIFIYLRLKIIFSVLLLKKTLKYICIWKNIPIFVISFILTVIGIIINSFISLAVYGIIVKYDNSEEKNKLVTTIYVLFYLVSYNYYNQLIKKFVNVHLSRTFSNFIDNHYEGPWKSVEKSFILNFGSVFIGSFAIALLGIIKKIPEFIKLFFSPLIFVKSFILHRISNDNQSVVSLSVNFVITLVFSPIHALLYYIVNPCSSLINIGMKPFEGIVISISGITGSSCLKSSKKAEDIKESNEKNYFDCSSFIGYILFVGQFGITWLSYIVINSWSNGNKNNTEEEMKSILEITKKIDDLGLIVLICNKIFFGLIKSILQASFDTSLVYYLDNKEVVEVPYHLAKYQIVDKYLDIENYIDLDLKKNIKYWFEKIKGDEIQDFEEMFHEFLPLPGDK